MEKRERRILVTGAAGFIGAALCTRLLSQEGEGVRVIGVDNLNDYYDPALKRRRIAHTEDAARSQEAWRFAPGDITDRAALMSLFETERPDYVVHLAAQAGVRHSIEQPEDYIQSNVVGFFNILEACRAFPPRHLVYASSSSVYGERGGVRLSVTDRTDSPISLYAATKKSDEVMAHAYSGLYGIPATGLRFFTVYGPYGRPDMACWRFAEALAAGRSIELYNSGESLRDFTYIDDVVEGIVRVMQAPPEGKTRHVLFNIGGGSPIKLTDFARTLAEEMHACGLLPPDFRLEEHMVLRGPQPGDVTATCADTEALEKAFGFVPRTGLREGLRAFVRWYAAWEGRKEDA